MILSGAAVRFVIIYALSPTARIETVAAFDGYLRAGFIKHNVAQSFSLDEIAAAHEAVESGKMVGNVVLKLAD